MTFNWPTTCNARSIEWFEAARVEWALAIINGDCGVLAARLGLVEAASEHNQAARRAAQYLRLGGYEAILLSRLGSLALEAGDVDRADLLTTEALDLAEHVRFSNAEAFAHSGRAMVRRVQGRYDEAEQSANTAVELFLTTGVPHGHTQALSTLGFIAQHRGDVVTARQDARRGDGTRPPHDHTPRSSCWRSMVWPASRRWSAMASEQQRCSARRRRFATPTAEHRRGPTAMPLASAGRPSI